MNPSADAGELVVAAGLAATEPELLQLALGLAGGLALFLFGLEQMTNALKAVAGGKLRVLLARLTTNRLTGVATGAFVTAVIQSSSVTTVLLVSFISSGLLSLSQAVGVILGANIGTTVTAQIVAFKVTKLAFAMIAAGFAVSFVAARENLRHHGNGIFGLGLVFLGMTVMGEAMAPLRHYPPFLAWMVRLEDPLLGVTAAAAFTALVQSSSAMTGVVIALASQGLIALPAGIALIFGANVGTCVTALLAAIGKPREAVRAALVHVLFNILGVLLWIAWIDELAAVVTVLSPRAPELAAAERLAAETPRQIANAHTLFNVANTLVFLPFSALLARVVERLVPDRPLQEEEVVRARYLDEALLATPGLALQQARRELVRLANATESMLSAVLPAMLTGGRDSLDAVAEMDDAVDLLYDHIVAYLARISERPLSEAETVELFHLMAVANLLESSADVIETNLVSRGRERVAGTLRISPETRKVIEEFHSEVTAGLREASGALADRSVERARNVVAMKPTIQALADRAAHHQVQRLTAPEDQRVATYALETDMIEDLRRIYYFAKRVAHEVIDFESSKTEAPPA
jgi:phosphate:Na+ symporter